MIQEEIKITSATVFVNPYTEPDEEEQKVEEEKKATDDDRVISISRIFLGNNVYFLLLVYDLAGQIVNSSG